MTCVSVIRQMSGEGQGRAEGAVRPARQLLLQRREAALAAGLGAGRLRGPEGRQPALRHRRLLARLGEISGGSLSGVKLSAFGSIIPGSWQFVVLSSP